jgi:hypothetical protein
MHIIHQALGVGFDSDASNSGSSTVITAGLRTLRQTGISLSGDFSIGTWVKLPSLPAMGNSYTILRHRDFSGGLGIKIVNSSGDITFQLTGGVTSSFATPLINTWYFLQAWRNGTTHGIFVNGVTNTNSGTSGIFDRFEIGANMDGAQSGSNPIEYDQAYRANSDIGSTLRNSLYNNGKGRKWSQLTGQEQTLFQAYYELSESSGNRLDSTGNGNTLSENGGSSGNTAGVTI